LVQSTPPVYTPGYICIGGIIIDDIVLPDGRTTMGVLGGGVTHAAAGMIIWGQRPGLVSCAGRDLPDAARRRLERDFDLGGMRWLDQPQARAWQLFEWDGRRTEIFRVDELEPFLYGPGLDALPSWYREARGAHLLRDGAVAPWRDALPGATVLWEPIQPFMMPQNAAAFRAALPLVDIVSPNWVEAQALYGRSDPAALVHAMLDDGARVAVLRMGEQGSIAGRQGDPDLLRVPVVPVAEIVDQTGAGNTYCGAFLVGWCQTADLAQASAYGAVAASFALEVTGVADPPADYVAQRDARVRALADRLEVVR